LTVTSKLKINHKIITLADVKVLAKIFDEHLEEALKIPKPYLKPSQNFEIELEDDTLYQHTSSDILDKDYAVNSKRVVRISLYLRFFDTNDHQNSIRVTFSNSIFDNTIEISGDNALWVNGVQSQLSKAIDGFQPQSFLSRLSSITSRIIFLILSFPITFFSISIIFHYFFPLLALQSYSGLISIIAVVITISLLELIVYLYPPTEISIGPKHRLKEQIFRNFLKAITIIIAVPYIIWFTTYLIGKKLP